MESVDRSKNKSNSSSSRLVRTIAKFLHLRAVSGEIAPDDEDNAKVINNCSKILEEDEDDDDDDDEEERAEAAAAAMEGFLAKVFASLSGIKAGYAQLQFAQSPYDPNGIQSADKMIIFELKNLSELKQCYLKKQLGEYSHETTQIMAEIQEQKNLLKTYEITVKKMDSQLKLKDSEIIFQREKLDEINAENKSLQERVKKLNYARTEETAVVDKIRLKPMTYLVSFVRQTVKSVRSFVRLLITEMVESAEWDLDAAAKSIEPNSVFRKSSHKCYAFESFVCREMFEGFSDPEFLISNKSSIIPEQDEQRHRQFFDNFMKLRSVKAMDYLAWKPNSPFSNYCRSKYLRLIHPRLEISLFGNTDQRNLINNTAGEFPETSFFVLFTEMAKRIWMLHCLAFSFNPEATIFQVNRGSRFSEVYMESITDDDDEFTPVHHIPETELRVGFTVVPGFRIGKTVIQCQVYLC